VPLCMYLVYRRRVFPALAPGEGGRPSAVVVAAVAGGLVVVVVRVESVVAEVGVAGTAPLLDPSPSIAGSICPATVPLAWSCPSTSSNR
jgi:hypothetical protein